MEEFTEMGVEPNTSGGGQDGEWGHDWSTQILTLLLGLICACKGDDLNCPPLNSCSLKGPAMKGGSE